MKKNHGKYRDKHLSPRALWRKRVRIGNDLIYKTIDAYTLADLACISHQHAYRIINNPESMTPTIRRLLEVLLLGQVPGWPPGWSFYDGRLWSPSGIGYYPEAVENTGLERQLHEHIAKDNERLQSEVNRLRRQMAVPRELRVYINEEKQPRRVLEVGEAKKKRTA